MRSLTALVFSSGAVILGMELTAARLLEPALGSNQILWATLIGLILLYLSMGAWLGGRLADRYPRRAVLDIVMVGAGVAVATIPAASGPILRLAVQGMATFSSAVLAPAVIAVLLLFSIPGILLGTATPWAVRLAVPTVEVSGATTGRFYAAATAGSILGAFLPALWLIPSFGVRWTFYLFALWLLLVVGLGAFRAPHRWAPLIGLAAVGFLIWLAPPNAPLRSGWEEDSAGTIIYEDETRFHFIAVRQWGSERHLEINDGIGIHSVYHPDTVLSLGIWDYFLLPPLATVGAGPLLDDGVLVIGLAAGTVPALITDIYGPVPMTGVELDPAIIEAGRRFFDMNQANLTAVAADGRAWLAAQPETRRWDLVAVDAYRPPYIPFHLTTVEFFTEIAEHLTEEGVVAINVGRTDTDFDLVNAMVATMSQVFPHLLILDEPGPPDTLANSLIIAARRPLQPEQLAGELAARAHSLPEEFVAFAVRELAAARVVDPQTAGQQGPIFTDNHAPVERVVHGIILAYLTGGQ